MAKVLIIPDVHLKYNMFDMANNIMKQLNIDQAVFLGDLVDDWNQENNIELYKTTIDKAIQFKKLYPKSLYCWGNHEVGYLTDTWTCPGNSSLYRNEIRLLLNNYEREVEPYYIQCIDDCLFSHAGIEHNLLTNLEDATNHNVTTLDIMEMFNYRPFVIMNDYNSVLWTRPDPWTEYYSKFIQIIGHSPVETPMNINNVWIVDTFSTTPNGTTFGNKEFMVIDTITHDISFYKISKNKVKCTRYLKYDNWKK